MLTYLLEVTLCWTLLYGIFYLCMRRETFFTINRWYLLSALILGLLVPLLRLIPIIEEVELYNRQVAEYMPIVYVIKDTPAIVAHTITEQSIEWGSIFQMSLWAIYVLGCMLFLFRFIKGLTSIYNLYERGEKIVGQKHTLVKTSGNHLPFSFLQLIFVSKTLPLDEDYNRILTHELEHVHARHSIDVLFLEIINIIFWFHPMIYLYKSALRQTHEYLADAAVCGTDSRQLYGQLLLRQSLSGLEIALAHHFFHSHIKKRINMIYQEKSGRKAWLKYALAVPALAVLMLVFTSQTTTDAENIERQNDNLIDIIDLENDNLLSDKQQERLKSEVLNLFQKELSTSEKEKQLGIIQKKWNKKYPRKKDHIQNIISFSTMGKNNIIFRKDGKVKIIPIPKWIPNQENIDYREIFKNSLPSLSELSEKIERTSQSVELSLIHNYFVFRSYYSDDAQLQIETSALFERYIKENNIKIGFELKDIHIEYNTTTPELVKDYINTKDESTLPIFWGQSMDLFVPHHSKIDLRYPIGFFAYLTPSQSKILFGAEGQNGLIAVSNYTLSPDHPQIQSTRLNRDIENFFSTIKQLPAKSWANKLKEVSRTLKSKYPNALDHITPYTTIANEHNITLVFEDDEIIKAFRGDGNSTERIDSESKHPLQNGKIKISAKGKQLEENLDYKVDHKEGKIKMLNQEYLKEGIPIRVEFEEAMNSVKKLRPKTETISSKTLSSDDFNLSQPFIKSVYENFIVPKELRSKGVEGAVVILLNINSNNRITNYRVAHGLNDQLSISAEQTMKASETIEVIDETVNIDLSQTYALNFIIEHDTIINSSSDSLLAIIHNDKSIEVLDEFKIMYYFKPSTDKKASVPNKSTKDKNHQYPSFIKNTLGISEDSKDLTVIVNGKLETNPNENINPNEIKSVRFIKGQDALTKYPELNTENIVEIATRDKSMNTNSPKKLNRDYSTDEPIQFDTIITFNPETYEETIEIKPSAPKESDSKSKLQSKTHSINPAGRKTGLPNVRDPQTDITNPSDTLNTIQFDPKKKLITRTRYIGTDTSYIIQTFEDYFRSMPEYAKLENRITSDILSYQGNTKSEYWDDSYNKQIKVKSKNKKGEIQIQYESPFREDVTFFLFDISRNLIDSKSVKHTYPNTPITFENKNLHDKVYFIGSIQGGKIGSSTVKM